MNYYIQGDAAKADKIKAAFEKLGYEPYCWTFETEFYFTVDCTKTVQIVSSSSKLINIIKTHPDYKELELPVEPFKVGDWIVCWNRTYQIIDNKSTYIVREINSLETRYEHSTVDENGHLWAIADAKDGDVLATDNGWTCIFKSFDGYAFSSYYFMDSQNWFCESGAEGHTLDSRINGNIHPATKEQRELLFKKMKEAGYQWNKEKKELRKIQPHYDIANFQPKQWVLVRDDDEWEWALTMFSYLSNGSASLFVCINGASFQQCIPYEGNEALLGTTDMCDEQYINW